MQLGPLVFFVVETLKAGKWLLGIRQAMTVHVCADFAYLAVDDWVECLLVLMKANTAAELGIFDNIAGMRSIIE